MSELKSCPFCGRIPSIWHEDATYAVWCDNEDCHMTADTNARSSEQAAIKAWNTRAGRTCTFDFDDEVDAYVCSMCDCFEYEPDVLNFNYCPNCGARIDGGERIDKEIDHSANWGLKA